MSRLLTIPGRVDSRKKAQTNGVHDTSKRLDRFSTKLLSLKRGSTKIISLRKPKAK